MTATAKRFFFSPTLGYAGLSSIIGMMISPSVTPMHRNTCDGNRVLQYICTVRTLQDYHFTPVQHKDLQLCR